MADIKLHNMLREKIRDVYTQVPIDGIYFNSRGTMEFKYQTPNDSKVHKTSLDPMVSSVIINAIVPKSGVIFRGGHGGGKSTLVEKVSYMLTGIPEDQIISARIQGNDDQNVNTLLATLKFGKLMVKGEEEISWRKFVTSYVKIVDEVNRFPPPAQNALFEILNKGRVEFIDNVYTIDDYIFFATENPNDPGTYPLSRPFLDRFSFCVPAPQIPTAADQSLLSERIDDKLINIKATPVLNLDDLKQIRKMVSQDVKMVSETLLYTIYLTQALSTCERGDYYDKSHNNIAVGERCKSCGFDTPASLCKMTESGLSGRAFLDFQRWGKAYAWFLNAFPDSNNMEVPIEVIQTIAPYLMYHRIEANETVLAKDPYHGAKLKFLEEVVNKVTQNYNTVKEALVEIPAILRGDLSPKDAKLNSVEKDLVVRYHFKPLIAEADKPEFRDIFNSIEKNNVGGDRFVEISRRLSLGTELQPHAQKYLLSKLMSKAKKDESTEHTTIESAVNAVGNQ